MKSSTILGLIAFLTFLVVPLVSAGNYGAGTYGSGVYGTGEVTTSPGGGGSSSSGASTTPGCSQNSDCGENRYCFEGACFDAQCFEDSSCNTIEGETCWNFQCVKLFDIKILDFESPAKLGEFFDFTYFIKGAADVNGDVEIHFWIEQDGNIVTSGSDVIYMGSFEERTETTKLFLPSDIASGTYEFLIQVNLGTYTAEAHRTIEITVSEEGGTATIGFSPEIGELKVYITAALIGLAVFILFFIFFLGRKRIKRFIKEHKIFVAFLGLLVILGVLLYYSNSTGLTFLSSISNFLITTASWVKTNVLIYFSPQNRYFYYVIGSIAGLIILITIIIIAKKKHLSKKLIRKTSSKIKGKKEGIMIIDQKVIDKIKKHVKGKNLKGKWVLVNVNADKSIKEKENIK
ncbi:MAG: hypothetical protein IIA87_05850 [Nanoarchaeota archaeon]|nr:hypothetical protein [Nanoarchaeota archaeon]